MARPSYPRAREPLPAPLPPELRTVGQLVAETIKLFQQRFWSVLPLGIAVAVQEAVGFGHSLQTQTLLLWAFAPALTVSFVWASRVATGVPLTRRSALTAFAVGIAVFLPFPVLLRLYILPGLALFALVGLAVPAAVAERLGFRAALRRGISLGTVDFVHAFGGILTLAVVFVLSRAALLLLLHTQSDQTQRVAGFLADFVLAPLLFLGPALLYIDQAARYPIPSASHSRR